VINFKTFNAKQTVLPYFDIHCHSAQPMHEYEIRSLNTHEFNPADTQSGFYTLGLHPWFIDRQDCQVALEKIIAVQDDPNMLGIGESGLDKAIDIDLAVQLEVFNSQIALAEKFHKPLIIHCVRAYNELLQCKKHSHNAVPWIIHGFTGKPELARQLVRQGFYLSFGQALLHGNANLCKVLSETPLEKLFLETDAAEISIRDIYAAAAKILGLELEKLQQQLLSNFQRVFLHD
jgi:TatD DNase family protein